MRPGSLSARTLAPGAAEGPVFVLAEPLSFWGGLDAASGRIIDRWHPQQGQSLAGTVLLMRAGRGSSSGSSVLAEAIRRRTAPCAIVLLTADAIVTTGALVARELYGTACPVVLAEARDWLAITAAPRLAIEAGEGQATLWSVG
ncbi:MAG TPA: DUF126 domain-containing protein [Microvirga sp.]|jgi:predicted aconitase with swiveling domain